MYFSGTIPCISSEPGELVFLPTGAHKPAVPGVESDDVRAKAQWTVDEKSGTGGLKGVKGKGRISCYDYGRNSSLAQAFSLKNRSVDHCAASASMKLVAHSIN